MKGPRKPDGASKAFSPTPVLLNRNLGGRPPGQHVSSHGGREIEPRVRAPFEAKLSHDFSSVRVHDGAEGASVAAGHKAQAVTVGADVFFGAARYAPHSQPAPHCWVTNSPMSRSRRAAAPPRTPRRGPTRRPRGSSKARLCRPAPWVARPCRRRRNLTRTPRRRTRPLRRRRPAAGS